MPDLYDGVTIGDFVTERFIEDSGLINSISFNKIYALQLDPSKSAQDVDVKNTGDNDTSIVYLILKKTELTEVTSNAGDGLIATSYEDDYAVQGYEWTVNAVEDIGATAVLQFLLDFSAVPSTDGIFVLPVMIKSSASEVRFRLYEDTDYSGGTTITPWNRNRAFQQAKNFVITGGVVGINAPTGTDKGTLLPEHAAFAASQGNIQNSAIGGTSRPIILDRTKKYLLELENTGGDATTIEYEGLIFQIPFS